MGIQINKIDTITLDLNSNIKKKHREIVIEASDLYPGIDIWYDRKVFPGIKSGDRVGYLISKNNKAVGAAIAKQGENAKICTIRIRDESINEGLGSILFLLLAHSMRHNTKRVHFTAPEYLWNKYEIFFIDLGFKKTCEAGVQYRLFDPEIVAEADYNVFKERVHKKYFSLYAGMLANIDDHSIKLLLSVHPEYANRIRNKTKIMEIRRKFSKKWIGSSALIYSTYPEQAIVAKVEIKDVVEGSPVSIWNQWREAIDCREEDFYKYANNSNIIYGILLDNIKEIGPFYLSSMQKKVDFDLKPPQPYLDLSRNKEWRSAIELSSLSMQIGI